MYTPKLKTKRVLGLALAVALTLAGTVALAGNSEAAVATVKPSPATGSTVGGTVVTVTGTGFEDSSGTSTIGTVWFETVPCAIADIGVNPVVLPGVISAAKIVVTTPALALTASPVPTVYNLCISNTGDAAVIGTAKFTSYAVPTINDQSTALTKGLTPIQGLATVGTVVTIKGENFTAKTTATIGGVPLTKVKVTVGPSTAPSTTAGDDVLTGTVPAGTGTAKSVVVTSEGGASVAAAGTYSYIGMVTASPKSGKGALGNGITVTGSGFSALAFGAPATAVALAPAPAQVVLAFGTPTSPAPSTTVFNCGNVQVSSDKSLSCTLTTAVPDGAYTVMVLTDTDATHVATASAISTSATYLVTDF